MKEALDELQRIVNEMQAINKQQDAYIFQLQSANNKLSVVHDLQENKIRNLINENNDLLLELAVAKAEAGNIKALLVAECNKSWWTKLWE